MAKGRAFVRDIDRGYARLLRSMQGMNAVVSVGIHQDTGAATKQTRGKGSPMTLLDVATAHEYGGPWKQAKDGTRYQSPPRRSFIRDWFDEELQPNLRFVVKVSQQVLKGKMSELQALTLMGLKFQGAIRARISRGIAPELSDETIKRKGSSKPLIDTGQLRAGVSWEIEQGNDPKPIGIGGKTYKPARMARKRGRS
jgi:hypothetical protein